MMHLKYEELYQLAEASVNDDGFDDTQIKQLEHLKTCRDCYESFCLLSALSDVMSESGGYVLSREATATILNDVAQVLKTTVLAKIQVVRKSATNAFGAVLKQVDQTTSYLKFGPSLAMVTRGGGMVDSKAIRFEEFEDDKTYIIFDPESNEVKIQINISGMEIDTLNVYLMFEDSTKLELPVSKRGNIVKGILDSIPSGDFQIIIEKE